MANHYALAELKPTGDDDVMEASGKVYYFCSELHREVFRSQLIRKPHAPFMSSEAIGGTVCDYCGKELEV